MTTNNFDKQTTLLAIYQALQVADKNSTYADSERTLAKIMGITRSDLLQLDSKQVLDQRQLGILHNIFERLDAHEPLAYILGSTEFYGLEIKVENGILIPRPETEQLVQIVLDRAKTIENPNILEVGIGSGCILCSISHELETENKDFNYTGIDISETATRVTNENVDYLISKKEIISIQLTSLPEMENLNREVDILVSNPPYLTSNEYWELDASVKDYEPVEALVGGDDGLKVYREINEFIVTKLTKKPFLALEINPLLVDELIKLYSETYSQVVIIKDVFGRDRFLVATN